MLVAGVAWVAAAAVVAVRTLDAADDARASLHEVRADLSIDALLDGTARDRLHALGDDLASVRAGARSPVLAPLRVVPGLARQLRSADSLSDAGLEGTAIGTDMLDQLEHVLEGPLPVGTERVALVTRVRELLEDGRRALGELSLGPDGPLLPSLADARNQAATGLADLDDFLVRAEAISGSVLDLLMGGDYLVLAANNAEMRAGSGMFLQVGELDATEGAFDVAELHPAKDIVLPGGAVVDAGSPTYDELWGFLGPSIDWRNLATSPRFDVTAELATRMWEALGNPRPSGVLAVDPFAIRALLRATGPVEVDGRTIDADEVVPFLLNRQYDVFADAETYDDFLGAQDERRDLLGGLVDATFAALGSAAADPAELLEGLRNAVRGRHILAWSSDPEVQAGWEAAEMSGTLDVDSIMVSVLNRGINKLDPFLDVSVDLRFEPLDAETRRGILDVAVTSDVPDGEVRYVAGPVEGIENVSAYGDYAGILSVILPGVARNARIEGVTSLEVAAVDGPVLSAATKFGLPRDGRQRFRVSFELPAELASVRIEPDARPEPVTWTAGERRWDDGQHHRVTIEPDS